MVFMPPHGQVASNSGILTSPPLSLGAVFFARPRVHRLPSAGPPPLSEGGYFCSPQAHRLPLAGPPPVRGAGIPERPIPLVVPPPLRGAWYFFRPLGPGFISAFFLNPPPPNEAKASLGGICRRLNDRAFFGKQGFLSDKAVANYPKSYYSCL